MKDDQTFFEQLILPIHHRMMRSIWRVVRNAETAEDTYQDALTTIWRKRGRIQKHPNPEALILKICLNAAYDSLRRSKHHVKGLSLETLLQDPISPPEQASKILEEKKNEAEILTALGRLPRNQALAMLMRVIQDQSFSEISEVLGCSDITARIHVSRGRAKLCRWLKHLLPTSHKEQGQ